MHEGPPKESDVTLKIVWWLIGIAVLLLAGLVVYLCVPYVVR